MSPTEQPDWRRKRIDRALGIALGIVLGIAVVIVFVFYGSGDTIDAPSIEEDDRAPVERPRTSADPR